MKRGIISLDVQKLFDGTRTVSQLAELFNCDSSNIVYHLNKKKVEEDALCIEEWIRRNCFSRSGSLNNRISADSWWSNRDLQGKREEILEETSWLETENIFQRIWHVLNGICEVPRCETCGEKVAFRQFKSGYRQYCSIQCATQSEERNRKIGEHPSRKIAIEKARQTIIERYGEDYYKTGGTIQEKMKKAKLEKYGCHFANKEKAKKTCLKKYGKEYYFQTDEGKEKSRKTKIERDSLYQSGNFGNISIAEKEIVEFFSSMDFDFRKTRNLLGDGREIDGYCETKKFAFEYCGLYWHSELCQKDKNYHLNKLQECRAQGVQLVTIFEDEWTYGRKYVEQFLRARLGVFERRIFARKCSVVVDRKPFDFFRNNHIQGAPNRINFDVSLLYEGRIVSSMSFGIHHRNNVDMTLNRYASLSGIQVVGGASRLFSAARKFLKNKIVTWSDNRWTEGNLYKNLGFVLAQEYSPDYSYVDGRKRVSKQSQMKSHTGCPIGMTEHQWALQNKLYRIYDCGKKKWIFT